LKVITSFSKALYNQYAHRVVETFKNWPAEAKLIIYSEDMTGESGDRIEWRPMDFPDLVQFKAGCKPSDADYRFDAAKFSNKVWAMVEGSMNETGLVFWLDADCITHRKLSAEFVKRLIPPSFYMGSFQRPQYVESGFWGVRANHEHHKAFMTYLKDIYTSGKIFKLPQWHDCYALDTTRQWFSGMGKIKAVNFTESLRGSYPGTTGHVMATSQLGKYIDHCKGERKSLGYSPECSWRVPVLGDGQRRAHKKIA
jgi:hypothetical protein